MLGRGPGGGVGGSTIADRSSTCFQGARRRPREQATISWQRAISRSGLAPPADGAAPGYVVPAGAGAVLPQVGDDRWDGGYLDQAMAGPSARAILKLTSPPATARRCKDDDRNPATPERGLPDQQ